MKLLPLLAGLAGLLLVILAVVYFAMPASSLPSFVPGFDPTLTKHHYTHGVASLLVGLVLIAFWWFKSKKSAK
ncbi:MAG TPA: hypothetical protein VLF68_02085 [Candidatus Saccharimonadales bacterium]|nr:hypothetical protein [Candidatus Saccharimonadales bacterium]